MESKYKNIANILLSKIWEDFSSRCFNVSSLWTENEIDMWEFLFEKNLHEIKDSEDSFFALAAGIEHNNFELVSFLIKNGVNLAFEVEGYYFEKRSPHLRKETKKTPGMLAVEKGDLKLIKFLFSVQDIVNQESSEGETMFSWAVKNDNLKLVEYLISIGVNIKPSRGGIKGNHPIHNAVQNCNYDMIKLLVKNGADVDVVNERGESILHLAFYCAGSDVEGFEMIKFLTTLGVNPNIKAEYRNGPVTPFDTAMDYKRCILGEISKQEYQEIADFLKNYEKEYNNKVLN